MNFILFFEKEQRFSSRSSNGTVEDYDNDIETIHNDLNSSLLTYAISQENESGDILIRKLSPSNSLEGAIQIYTKDCSPLVPLPLYENPPRLTGIDALERRLTSTETI